MVATRKLLRAGFLVQLVPKGLAHFSSLGFKEARTDSQVMDSTLGAIDIPGANVDSSPNSSLLDSSSPSNSQVHPFKNPQKKNKKNKKKRNLQVQFLILFLFLFYF